VLRGDFFELADDGGFFFDGGFDLSYKGGVCILNKKYKKASQIVCVT
jgi:hypothetical protein